MYEIGCYHSRLAMNIPQPMAEPIAGIKSMSASGCSFLISPIIITYRQTMDMKMARPKDRLDKITSLCEISSVYMS